MSFTSLQGVRVLDLGIVTAGASTSAVLADLGAEVIKVEGPLYIDPFREWSGQNDGPNWWNESPQFQATNRNKRSVCLDLKSPQGLDLFMKLATNCHVVVENFRAGVLKRLKIDFERLTAINPRIILASISSQGQDGPESTNSSFGSTLEASSGMAALMRYPGEAPQITGRGLNYPDQVASLFSASAIIAALVESRRTGVGAALDLSQRELTSFLVGEALIAASAHVPLEPYDTAAPGAVQGVFKARDGQWVAVTVLAGESHGVVKGLAASPTRDALERWIAALPAPTAAGRLRAAGIAAEVVWTARAFDDPDALVPQDAFALDSEGRQVKGLPLRLGGQNCRAFRAAPALGRDNSDVARDLLGLAMEEYQAFVGMGLFSDRPDKVRKSTAM